MPAARRSRRRAVRAAPAPPSAVRRGSSSSTSAAPPVARRPRSRTGSTRVSFSTTRSSAPQLVRQVTEQAVPGRPAGPGDQQPRAVARARPGAGRSGRAAARSRARRCASHGIAWVRQRKRLPSTFSVAPVTHQRPSCLMALERRPARSATSRGRRTQMCAEPAEPSSVTSPCDGDAETGDHAQLLAGRGVAAQEGRRGLERGPLGDGLDHAQADERRGRPARPLRCRSARTTGGAPAGSR